MKVLNIVVLFLRHFQYRVFCDSECRRPDGIPCCYNEYMDEISKQCKACEPGLIGWKCEEPCKKGYYGVLCRLPCLCSPNNCDPEVGCPTTTNEHTAPSIQFNWRMSKGFADTVKYPAPTLSTKIHGELTAEQELTTGYAGTRTQKLNQGSRKYSTIHKETLTNNEQKTTSTGMQWHSQRSEYDTFGFTKITRKQRSTAKPTSTYVIRQSDSRDILQHISEYMELISISLFLVVGSVVTLILLLLYHTWKRSRTIEDPTELKQFNTGQMYCRQLRGTLERGYMSLSNRERLPRSGRQSDYVMPNSLDIDASSTI
ncbi:uncharacterized protein LOC125664479 [Ostrea edulis]|uniref:uncharacterized protein LOC125664479 n=1 Tax=Ostrea edulis TaxID=37623 RepID=UPI0020962CC4|nr:uncharacterized protein LOC125664479 [Ostrea edulis]